MDSCQYCNDPHPATEGGYCCQMQEDDQMMLREMDNEVHQQEVKNQDLILEVIRFLKELDYDDAVSIIDQLHEIVTLNIIISQESDQLEKMVNKNRDEEQKHRVRLGESRRKYSNAHHRVFEAAKKGTINA